MGTTLGTPHPNARETDWRDPKRYAWLLGMTVPLIPFLSAALVRATGLGLLWWYGPIFMFVILPPLDAVIGKDSSNPPESVMARMERDRYYCWCVYLFTPLQYAALFWACAKWSAGTLSVVDALGLAITVGVVGGLGINTAHELGHKSDRVERWLSKITLAQTAYGHFYVEHNRGHHVRVATPEDPASARLGESFWAFWPRTVVGSLASAWEIETRRLRRKGKPVLSIENEILNAWAITAALFGVLIAIFGVRILPWLAIQAVLGFSLLEVVNYVEHYGLARQKGPDGRYEPCAPRHSWNSDNIASNVVLFHLQRHSDHHAYPSRRYQVLRSFEEAPELPAGYGAMIILALIPPIWRRIMDPKVIAHYEGNLTLANVQPSWRKRYGLEPPATP